MQLAGDQPPGEQKRLFGLRRQWRQLSKVASQSNQQTPRLDHPKQLSMRVFIGKHLLALSADDAAYRKHFEWDLTEFATRPTVAQCPWQCRVCEMMLARRSTSGGEAAGSAEGVAVSDDAATTIVQGS